MAWFLLARRVASQCEGYEASCYMCDALDKAKRHALMFYRTLSLEWDAPTKGPFSHSKVHNGYVRYGVHNQPSRDDTNFVPPLPDEPVWFIYEVEGNRNTALSRYRKWVFSQTKEPVKA